MNDNSTSIELYEPLQSYVERNFNGLVRIFNMKERRGLTVGRLEGARLSKGEVLVALTTSFVLLLPLIAFRIEGVFRRSGGSKCELASSVAG